MGTTIVDRPAVVAALDSVWATIDGLVAELDDAGWRSPSSLPGWSVADLVAHIIGTERFLLGEQPPEPDVDVTELDHVRNDIGALNEKWILHYRAQGTGQLLADFRQVTATRRAQLAEATDESFAVQGFTPAGPDTYGRFMRIRVFDCWMHEVDIRDALGLPAPSDAETADVAYSEIANIMPYVVGKKAGTPDGSAVRMSVSGLLNRAIDVAVDGRAALVPGLDRQPDVVLACDTIEFARLAGGRANADPAAVAVSGNADLAAPIIANLAFTI
ncbi:maleylpyruvate isomerase family mycothiol-dependent enzyme [Jongsikchunia kroppenstedtii]|jgi:uncharacterized protein (TIGR03083 family)|uniref:maleylpyruvate isomerase family mycothiol-dependent enzyme n=1 Tax=Jongsikchunia kroppenstedtii TaxID=1121721 RepID=UPI000368A208|nr:maleylpyruvate isomerase family mycothiol-dependent enzyme [Jongsikchunia kroppenstedtii]